MSRRLTRIKFAMLLILLPAAAQAQTQSLLGMALNPTTVIGGQAPNGQVTITGPAPPGGLTVQLSSSNPAVATVPSTTTVAAGLNLGVFQVIAIPVEQSTTVTITASAGGVTRTRVLTVQATVPSSVVLTPNAITGGASANAQLTLNGPAPANGLVVQLSSSNPAAATVPQSVTVAAGSTTTTFAIGSVPVAVSAAVTITATATGGSSTGALTVRAPTPASMTLSPNNLLGGATVNGQVSLTGQAPPGDIVVQLSSANPAVATVPASITIPAGGTSGSFQATAVPVAQTTTAAVTATASGVGKQAFLTVVAPSLTGVSVSPSSVLGGQSSTGQVTLNGPAPAGGLVVQLSHLGSSGTTTPPSVTVAEGSSTATFPISTGPVTQSTTVTIRGILGSANLTQGLIVTPPVPTAVTITPASVQGGQPSTGQVTLSGPAASGLVVQLSSTSSVAVPFAPSVVAGSTTVNFNIVTNAVALTTGSVITASVGGGSATAQLSVRPPVPSSVTLAPTSVQGGQGATGQVTISAPAPQGGLAVQISSSSPTVASSSPPSVTVATGATTASFSVGTVAVATTVSVTITADVVGVPNSAAQAALTVTAPFPSAFTLTPSTIAGGVSVTGQVSLSGPAPNGGLAVKLASSNTAVATVPQVVTVAAGATTVSFAIATAKVLQPTRVIFTAATGGGTKDAALVLHP